MWWRRRAVSAEEGGDAAVTNYLGTNLDKLLLQARQDCVDRLGRRQRREVAKVVSERMKLHTHRVGGDGRGISSLTCAVLPLRNGIARGLRRANRAAPVSHAGAATGSERPAQFGG